LLQTFSNAFRAPSTSPLTIWSTGIPSILSTNSTVFRRVSLAAAAFSSALRLRRASKAHSSSDSEVGAPSSVRRCLENAAKSDSEGESDMTIPPHCGRRNVFEGDLVLSGLRINRGREGTNTMKCRTGSLEALEAGAYRLVSEFGVTRSLTQSPLRRIDKHGQVFRRKAVFAVSEVCWFESQWCMELYLTLNSEVVDIGQCRCDGFNIICSWSQKSPSPQCTFCSRLIACLTSHDL
jgi:hypothetical protein